MIKAIIGRAKCLSYMVDVLNNYRFNRCCETQFTESSLSSAVDELEYKKLSFEDVNNFIPLIVPLGWRFISATRNCDNNNKCFLLAGSNCVQVIIYFKGDYDHIEFFQKESEVKVKL